MANHVVRVHDRDTLLRRLQKAWNQEFVNFDGCTDNLVGEFFVRHGEFTTEGTEVRNARSLYITIIFISIK